MICLPAIFRHCIKNQRYGVSSHKNNFVFVQSAFFLYAWPNQKPNTPPTRIPPTAACSAKRQASISPVRGTHCGINIFINNFTFGCWSIPSPAWEFWRVDFTLLGNGYREESDHLYEIHSIDISG